MLHWSGVLQDTCTCNLVLLTKLVNCKLVTVKNGALGFLVLQFWLFFRMGVRFQCQKTSVFFGFGVHCALHWILVFFLSIWFWAFVKTIMDFQIWYSMWFSVFPIWVPV